MSRYIDLVFSAAWFFFFLYDTSHLCSGLSTVMAPIDAVLCVYFFYKFYKV